VFRSQEKKTTTVFKFYFCALHHLKSCENLITLFSRWFHVVDTGAALISVAARQGGIRNCVKTPYVDNIETRVQENSWKTCNLHRAPYRISSRHSTV
jgi:hypothetical protein